jgi:hypothetical protein
MSKEPIITDQTFTYIINAADTPLEGRLDPFFDSERWILTSEWWQPMGSYLPSHTKQFECQTIRYEFGTNYINDGATSLDMATMIYSDINEYGKNSLAIDSKNVHRLYPISNYSNMCARFNGVRQGANRNSCNLTHDCKFICKNFNGQNKYFRLNTIVKNRPVNEFAPDEFFTTAIWSPNHYVPSNTEGIAIGYNNGNAVRYDGGYNVRCLKSFINAPITTIYMTPIPEAYEAIPRILLKEDSIIYTISSFERTENLYRNIANQILPTGAHCIVPFRKQKDSMVRKYKAQVIGFNFDTLLVDSFYIAANPNNFQMMFGFRTSCGWNKSKYGYLADTPYFGVEENITGILGATGGNRYSNLLSFRPTIDNDNDRMYGTSYGACFDINNEDTDVEFCVYSTMGYEFGFLGNTHANFPYKDLVEPKMDWILTLRLFPID